MLKFFSPMMDWEIDRKSQKFEVKFLGRVPWVVWFVCTFHLADEGLKEGRILVEFKASRNVVILSILLFAFLVLICPELIIHGLGILIASFIFLWFYSKIAFGYIMNEFRAQIKPMQEAKNKPD